MDTTQDSEERNKLFKIYMSPETQSLIATVCDVEVGDDTCMKEEGSRTELDSHANMPVVGRHAYIISDTGRVADVSPFTPDYKSMQIKIVDAAVQYDCQYSKKLYIFVIQKDLIHTEVVCHCMWVNGT